MTNETTGQGVSCVDLPTAVDLFWAPAESVLEMRSLDATSVCSRVSSYRRAPIAQFLHVPQRHSARRFNGAYFASRSTDGDVRVCTLAESVERACERGRGSGHAGGCLTNSDRE
jgi:hypothetical protein